MLHSIRTRLFFGYTILFMLFGLSPLIFLSPESWSSGRAIIAYTSLLALGALLALLLAQLGLRFLLRALDAIRAALHLVEQGNFTQVQVAAIPRELRPLADSYNLLSTSLHTRERELHTQLRRTALLTRLSLELRESLDAQAIVRDVLLALGANTDATSASIMLVGADGQIEQAEEWIADQLGPIAPQVAARRLEHGLEGWVLRQGARVVLGDAGSDSRWISRPDRLPVGSALVLPLSHGPATLGVLMVTHPATQHFTSADLLLIEGVAAQVGVAVSAARRYAEECRYREQALLLFSMTQFLTVQRSNCELAVELLEKSSVVFSAHYVALYLASADQQQLQPFVARRGSDPAISQVIEGLRTTIASVAERVWQAGEAVTELLPDTGSDVARGLVCIALPLLHNGTAIGVFAMIHQGNSQAIFPARIWSMLTTFTNVAAAAFSNHQLVEQLHNRAEVLEQQVHERTLQLERSRDLLRIVFDNVPDGLVLIDSQQHILTANRAFSQGVFEQPPKVLVGQKYGQLAEAHSALRWPRLAPQPTSGVARRLLQTAEDGRQRWFEVDSYTITAADGPQTIERWRDVTQQEAILRQLLLHEQLAAMGRLAANVVHELGNPLQSVRGCLDLCRESPALPDDVNEYLALADSQLDRMSQLLTYWRALYHPATSSWGDVDINQLAIDIRRVTARTLQRNKIIMEFSPTPGLPHIHGQPDALRQVLLNLVLNAQAALPQGGTIWLESHCDNERRTSGFCVADNGPGIAPEQLRKLFDPVAPTAGHGLGLGLYLARQIVERHQGSLQIDSTLGTGTKVQVQLPWSSLQAAYG